MPLAWTFFVGNPATWEINLVDVLDFLYKLLTEKDIYYSILPLQKLRQIFFHRLTDKRNSVYIINHFKTRFGFSLINL